MPVRLARVLLPLLLSLMPNAAVADDAVPLGPLPRTVLPLAYALELRMDANAEEFSGVNRIEVDVTAATDVIWMHARDMQIESATLQFEGGEKIPLQASIVDPAAGVLKLTSPAMLAPGKATLTIAYRARYDQNLQGAYQVKVEGASYIATQMEPLGARNAFPAFDEPAFKTPWQLSLIVPDGQNAVANTAQVGIDKVQDGWRKLRFAPTEKLPSYLVAFAVGPWDIVEWEDIPPNSVRKTPLKLRGIATRGRGAEMDYALRHTAQIVAELERYFDYPYPFDKLDLLAAPDFNFGAMENAGLIVYREEFLLGVDKAPTATRQGYWNIHAHELAHQWFGNLVTMPWWDDIWLNEAFATWMASKVVHALQPGFHAPRRRLEGSLGAMGADSLASTRRIHEPVHDYTDVISAFDGITYQKGGAVLSMFESFLGEERFRAAVRSHMREFARGSATSQDLMRSLAAQSDKGSELQAAFASFTDQHGVPLLRAQLRCRGERATLELGQHRYLPLGSSAPDSQRWDIPICVRYPVADGTRKQCALLSGASDTIALDAPGCPAWLHPNADGAGYYRFALDDAGRAALQSALPELDPREQRVFADSINAMFRNGSLDARAYLESSAHLAAIDAREVATAPAATLQWIVEHVAADGTARAALRGWIARTYTPRLQRVGLDPKPGDDDEARLLRRDLVELLALTAQDAELLQTLATRGRAMLALDGGALRVDAVAADQRGIALRAAAMLGGAAEFDAIQRHLRASGDALMRGYLLAALGSFTDPALARRARSLVLDDAVKSGETAAILIAQMDEPTLRDDARAWLRAQSEAVLAKLPRLRQSALPRIDAAGMCSTDEAIELASRYSRRVARLEGGPRALAQAEEGVRLCAALRDRQAEAGLVLPGSPVTGG